MRQSRRLLHLLLLEHGEITAHRFRDLIETLPPLTPGERAATSDQCPVRAPEESSTQVFIAQPRRG